MNFYGKKILFVVNRQKYGADEVVERLEKAAIKSGILTARANTYPVNEKSFNDADICCVIGGDGSILACVNAAVKYGVPIFGVNLGKLGFMATFTDSITEEEFLALLNGGGTIEERALIEAQYSKSKKIALNEFVIKSKNPSDILTISISANGEYVADFVGDGVIFSSPTGTSAYNLSAGGPLIYPKARAFAMTCICPHTLSNRSIVFDDSMQIQAQVKSTDAVLIADGKVLTDWSESDSLLLNVPAQTVKFIRPLDHSHFYILRTKLGWAENPRKLRG